MKGFVHLLEEEYAVVLCGDNDEIRVEIPRKLLPKGVRKGSWLTLSIEVDPQGSRRNEERVLRLLGQINR